METKLRSSVYHPLCEALRRFECFAVRRDGKKWNIQDIANAWTGLGMPSTYRAVCKAGYMRPLRRETPRILGWYLLTEKGAKIILAWHDSGYKCESGHELIDRPPEDISSIIGKEEIRT